MALYLLPNTEKLAMFRHKLIYCEGLFIQYMSVDMYWLPYQSGSRLICVLKKMRVSLYARASKASVFLFISFIFLSKNKQIQIQIIICFSHVRGCFYMIEDEGDLLVMTVVQYLQHVHNRNVLSSSCACLHTPNRCCCKK